jgi:hypothetical protein
MTSQMSHSSAAAPYHTGMKAPQAGTFALGTAFHASSWVELYRVGSEYCR